MSRIRERQQKLRTLRTLGEAVSALRALAAQNFRIARAELPHARAYLREIAQFVGESGARQLPEGAAAGPPGVLLLTADLGLVGDYATRLASLAEATMHDLGARVLISLGRRGLRGMSRSGIVPREIYPAPTGGKGLALQLLPVVDRVLELREAGELGALWLVSARFGGAGHSQPVARRLLPEALDPGELAPAAHAMSPYCPSERIQAVALREFLAASLHASLLEALCSEHGKRLVVAEGARQWLSERTEEQRRRIASLRREISTQEVFEVVSAARAAARMEASS